jgi:hypothetical protein
MDRKVLRSVPNVHHRDDALPLSETDRRVYVVRCADNPKNAKYYTQLYR